MNAEEIAAHDRQWAENLASQLAELARKCKCGPCLKHDAKTILKALGKRDKAVRAILESNHDRATRQDAPVTENSHDH